MKSKINKIPSLKYLQECFSYVPAEGKLFWAVRPASHFTTKKGWRIFNKKYAGKETRVTLESTGYRQVYLDGKYYMAHRIMWKLYTGEDPSLIDHIDRNKQNNKWGNLRLVSRSQNQINTTCCRSANNAIGCHFHQGKWIARIQKNYRRLYVGAFLSKKEAIAARKKIEKILYGEFSP